MADDCQLKIVNLQSIRGLMAINKKRDEGAGIDPNAWMVTFSDLIMLLLTFFVLLLSMSSMDQRALKRMFSVFEDAVGPLEVVEEKNVRPVTDITHSMTVSDTPMIDDGNVLKSMLAEPEDPELGAIIRKYGTSTNIFNDSRGVVISLRANILFDAGKTDINPELFPILNRLKEIIEMADNDILIVGHADDKDMSRCRSNWGLSFFRALSLLDYFLQGGRIPSERFCVGGAGPSRPRYANTSASNREKNRRVEIIFRK